MMTNKCRSFQCAKTDDEAKLAEEAAARPPEEKQASPVSSVFCRSFFVSLERSFFVLLERNVLRSIVKFARITRSKIVKKTI